MNSTPIQEIQPATVKSTQHKLITAKEIDLFPLSLCNLKTAVKSTDQDLNTAHHKPLPTDTVGLMLKTD